jgi:hypothetical protein
MLGIELNLSHIFLDDSETNRLGHDRLLRSGVSIKFANGFELEIKCEFCLVEILGMSFMGVEDG